MRTRQKKSSKKALIITAIIAVVLVAGGTAFALREQLGLVSSSPETTHDDTSSNTEATPDQDTLEQQEPEQEKTPSSDKDTEPATPATNDGTTDPRKAADEIIISSVNQDGNTLAIRTLIQPLVSGGQCTLTMGKVGQTSVRQESGIQAMPSYSTCKGFDVDVSNMAKGSWNVEVVYKNNGASTTGRGTAVVR